MKPPSPLKRSTLFFALMLFGAAGVLLAGCGGESSAESSSSVPAGSTQAASGNAGQSGLAAYDENGDGMVYQGGMHPDVVQDEPGNCPVCGMKLNPTRVDGGGGGGEGGSVRISPATIQNMGVRTTEVETAALGREIQTTGRFKMNEQGMEVVSLKVGGWVETLYADYEGDIVKKGQPLLELYSPELVSTQQEYLLALRNVRRLEGGPAAENAQRLLSSARRRLAYWDLTAAQIERLEETREPKRTMTFYAPASGEVMHKSVTEGQRIRSGQTLMHIADVSEVWLIVDIYEQDLSWVEVGTPARIELVSTPGKTYRGKIDEIYHMMDAETRTARARIELPGGHNTPLKPGAYATVYLEGERAEPAPVVPAEAVVSGGEREVVIEALGDGRFHPVPVRTGVQSRGRVQILSGLDGGEEIVTSAQFLIDSEARLQSALGAMTAGNAGSDSTDRSDVDASEAEATGGAWEKADPGRAASASDVRAADRDGDGFIFQGPMHPEVVRDAPGDCPVCEMNLERVPVEEAVQNFENAQ